MKIAAVLNPFNHENLAMTKQIGVDHVVYYNMHGMPMNLKDLSDTKKFVEDRDLTLSVVEGGPPIDRIVLGKAGRDKQIEQYKVALGNMGKLGIKVLCYDFMPQISDDAMVIRTSYKTRERGNALTSSFDLDKFDPEAFPHEELSTADEQMWDNLEYFLKNIVPAAEEAEVKLAMHPDDPPLSPMCGLSRIMRSVENFDRLLSIAPSKANGITLCQGCFRELGCDISEIIRHFARKIHFVHFRDVTGSLENFRETFPDNGPTNMVEVFKTYKEIGYEGFIRSDHVPLLATENVKADGYSMQGHIFAIGYIKGLMEPIFGKPVNDP